MIVLGPVFGTLAWIYCVVFFLWLSPRLCTAFGFFGLVKTVYKKMYSQIVCLILSYYLFCFQIKFLLFCLTLSSVLRQTILHTVY